MHVQPKLALKSIPFYPVPDERDPSEKTRESTSRKKYAKTNCKVLQKRYAIPQSRLLEMAENLLIRV